MSLSKRDFNSFYIEGDAELVDAIHTDATLYGSHVSVGHVDFYPGFIEVLLILIKKCNLIII